MSVCRSIGTLLLILTILVVNYYLLFIVILWHPRLTYDLLLIVAHLVSSFIFGV